MGTSQPRRPLGTCQPRRRLGHMFQYMPGDSYVSLYVSPPSETYRSPGRSICFTVCRGSWGMEGNVGFGFLLQKKKKAAIITLFFSVETQKLNAIIHLKQSIFFDRHRLDSILIYWCCNCPKAPIWAFIRGDLYVSVYVSEGGETYSETYRSPAYSETYRSPWRSICFSICFRGG
jgi:hypothetical protein